MTQHLQSRVLCAKPALQASHLYYIGVTEIHAQHGLQRHGGLSLLDCCTQHCLHNLQQRSTQTQQAVEPRALSCCQAPNLSRA